MIDCYINTFIIIIIIIIIITCCMEEQLLRYANFETSNNHAIVPCGLKSLNGRTILSSQHYVDRLLACV